MTPALADLTNLYADTKTCAKLVGLHYIEEAAAGIGRQKHGKGFSYRDTDGRPVTDKQIKERILKLAIPPAWQEVWICPSPDGHVLATGIDDRGRKQYIYHPKWRTMRDLIKFYRMISFARALPKLRRHIAKQLKEPALTRQKVIAAMLWILDNTYIRIGHDIYFQENESVGLTTLTDEHVVVAGPVVTLTFVGKSGKPQQITFEHAGIAELLDELRQVRGARLFRYRGEHGWQDITADDINEYLRDVSGAAISAKDFRTWGGTLLAFNYLIREDAKAKSAHPDKAIVAAVDQAAAILGNTRSVARSSYIHPDLLSTYGHKNFSRYYETALTGKRLAGLDRRENELLRFLETLFKEEFELLKT